MSESNTVARDPRSAGLFLQLAPMDGVTDAVFRAIITAQRGGHSGVSLCASEFVRVTDRRVPDKVLVRHCPELAHGGHTPAGVPVFVQLLGGEPQPLADTAAAAAALGAPGVDLNFGCPAKTVNRHDGGATILRTPRRMESLVAACRRALDPAVPVSVKIRLGWERGDEVEALAVAAEAGGASWLTIHARTRMQGYRPPVDWQAIGRARARVRIPVVANGDINTVEHLHACAESSACSAFMIGRGAMARPNLFRQIRGWDRDELSRSELVVMLEQYVAMLVAHGASPRGALGRIKQWVRLAAPAFEWIESAFAAVKTAREPATAVSAMWRHSEDPPTRDPRPRHPSASEMAC